MGLDCEIKEYFPRNNKHNFKLYIYRTATNDIRYTFFLFIGFDKKINQLTNQLFNGIDVNGLERGWLTPLEVKDLLSLMKLIINKPNFRMSLRK